MWCFPLSTAHPLLAIPTMKKTKQPSQAWRKLASDAICWTWLCGLSDLYPVPADFHQTEGEVGEAEAGEGAKTEKPKEGSGLGTGVRGRRPFPFPLDPLLFS